MKTKSPVNLEISLSTVISCKWCIFLDILALWGSKYDLISHQISLTIIPILIHFIPPPVEQDPAPIIISIVRMKIPIPAY